MDSCCLSPQEFDQEGVNPVSILFALFNIRAAGRFLRSDKLFTLVSVMTLALGLAISTSMFCFVHTMLYKALPYANSSELLKVSAVSANQMNKHTSLSVPDCLVIRSSGFLASVALSKSLTFTLDGVAAPQRVTAAMVSHDYFSLLGTGALAGRTLSQMRAGDPPEAAVISHRLWSQQFGRSTDILGTAISLDKRAYIVLGVMPPDFGALEDRDLWLPLAKPDLSSPRAQRDASCFGRMLAGSSTEFLRPKLDALARAVAADAPKTNSNLRFGIRPLREVIVASHGGVLETLSLAVLFVLLASWASVAQLIFARYAKQRRDLALRMALGASRSHIVAILLRECITINVCGLAFALVLAHAAISWIRQFVPIDTPLLLNATLDGPVILFASGLSLLATILVSGIAAVGIFREDPQATLRGSRTASIGRRYSTRDTTLIVLTAVSFVLFASSTLMIETILRLSSVALGYSTQDVMTLKVSLPSAEYAEPAKQALVAGTILSAVQSRIGKGQAALSTNIPFSSGGSTFEIYPEAQTSSLQALFVDVEAISPKLFQVYQNALLRGRSFESSDRAGTGRVAIINRSLAKLIWPEQNPIGKRLAGPWAPANELTEVVGLVEDMRTADLRSEPGPALYLPFDQLPAQTLYILVRGAIASEATVSLLKSAVWSVDRGLPISDLRSLEQIVTDSLRQPLLLRNTLSAFALFTSLMTGIGIYGVVAYWVARSTRQIGISIALGATRKDILRAVARVALGTTVAGLTAGLAFMALMRNLIGSHIYGVGPLDAASLGFGGLAILLITALATAIPAFRALSVDPVQALRSE